MSTKGIEYDQEVVNLLTKEDMSVALEEYKSNNHARVLINLGVVVGKTILMDRVEGKRR